MSGDRFSSSTSYSRWLYETELGRLDHAFSGRFLKVATHPPVCNVDDLEATTGRRESLATLKEIRSLTRGL